MPDLALSVRPQRVARICGLLYLYIIAAGTFAEIFVRGRLVVSGDAAATAANLIAHETLFRIGFSAELLHLACDVGVATLLYVLLAPVDRTLSLLAALLRFACLAVLAAGSLTHFAALRLLAGSGYLAAVPEAQRQALALFALRLHGDAYAIALVFFGFACLAAGWLIWRSGFLPRILGAGMGTAGICYLASSFGHFLAPTLAGRLFPALFLPIFVAELALALWLSLKGVDAARWRARAAGAAAA